MVVGVASTTLDNGLLKFLLLAFNNLGHLDFQWHFSLRKPHLLISSAIFPWDFLLWIGASKIDGGVLRVS